MNPVTVSPHYEVVIMGGGLAGLTLALQLRQRFADLSVLVLERRAHPVPVAAHKVGESTVEIGAHYFENVLGLKQHLQDAQLKKFGFRFFFSDGRRDLDQVTELGASKILPTFSYQIDRGIFENKLGQLVLEAGIDFIDQALVRQFTINAEAPHSVNADAPHTVSYEAHGQTRQVQCRWLIDASGRAGLIKRKLNLAMPNDHQAGAIWFRIDSRIDINDWSSDSDWLARCTPPNRWLSTNHLVGQGYWVWLIPLASGSHSVGIVADAALHPVEAMNTFETAMQWLERRQPRLYDHLREQLHKQPGKQPSKLQDFAFFKRFSYGCKQVFCGQTRWAISGEAGLFLDPFYSPGSDFIAIANTYITEMIAHDRNRAPLACYAELYEQIYQGLYQTMLTLYVDQYALFGDPEVLPHKVAWDYTYYWGIMCPLFFQNRLTDVSAMGRLSQPLQQSQQINGAMQPFLRAWGLVSQKRNPRQMLDQTSLAWFAELNRGLKDTLDDAAFARRMADNFLLLKRLARQLHARACGEHPGLASCPAALALLQLLPLLPEPADAPQDGESLLFSNEAYQA